MAVAWGLGEAAQQDFHNDLPNVRAYYRNAEDYTRGYIATGDPAQLAFQDVPYPTDGLIERLSHPALRALLPQSVRLALPLRPAAAANGVFLENNASQLHLLTEPRHGLAPATPPLPSRPTWGSFNATGAAATGEWTSAPLTAPLGGWLVFETAGQIGEPGVALELRDAQTHALLADVRPSKVPRNVWRAAYVRAPREPFVVVARDGDTQRWLAFSAPAEMSSLSYLGWQAAKNGPLIAYISGCAAGLLGLAALLLQRRSQFAR